MFTVHDTPLLEQPSRDSEGRMPEATAPTTFIETLGEANAEHVATGATGIAELTPESAPAPAATPQTIKVMVDGAEQEISFEEAAQGYLRQSDYTKKTQALATDRTRLTEAEQVLAELERDPQGTLARLAEHFQVAPGTSAEELEALDPLERDVLELQSFAEQQREAQFQAEIETEISRIQTAYSDTDLDPNALLDFAVENKIGNLDAAYRAMKFAPLNDERQTALAAQRTAADAAAEEAKRAAAVVDGGANRSSGTVHAGGDRPTSIAAAWAAAEQELMA